MNILVIGAPRNVGYYVSIRLLSGTSSLSSISLRNGMQITAPNLVIQAFLNTLSLIHFPSKPTLKILAVISNGLDPASHGSIPLALKPMYAWLLAGMHQDKAEPHLIILPGDLVGIEGLLGGDVERCRSGGKASAIHRRRMSGGGGEEGEGLEAGSERRVYCVEEGCDVFCCGGYFEELG
ncbi:hypothetical protein NEOLEDRAFT_1152056 [Neolentinus lepideus HHB14362 ss-1]|uniref:Uncharacterized protein n=1 Tax=Neolentinus lepideus HHB14362 ss-1 TaxID=1314782 RepID=A0A165N932_9AGAM|nr:hypothetical protein NEOLEDRAFT_1152056 [Neolentinus lepideus HHB14362 ss-1]